MLTRILQAYPFLVTADESGRVYLSSYPGESDPISEDTPEDDYRAVVKVLRAKGHKYDRDDEGNLVILD